LSRPSDFESHAYADGTGCGERKHHRLRDRSETRKQRSLSEQLPLKQLAASFRIWLLVTVAAAILGAGWLGSSSIGGWIRSRSDHRIQQEIQTLTLCELLANPKAHDLKVIRVRAVLNVSDGDRSLYDPACLTMEPMVGVVPDPSLHYDPRGGIPEKYYDLVKSDIDTKSAGAQMTMVGRFEGPNFLKDGRLSRFQHQFILMRIEAAEPEPPDVFQSANS
jgi:hypothetical protein